MFCDTFLCPHTREWGTTSPGSWPYTAKRWAARTTSPPPTLRRTSSSESAVDTYIKIWVGMMYDHVFGWWFDFNIACMIHLYVTCCCGAHLYSAVSLLHVPYLADCYWFVLSWLLTPAPSCTWTAWQLQLISLRCVLQWGVCGAVCGVRRVWCSVWCEACVVQCVVRRAWCSVCGEACVVQCVVDNQSVHTCLTIGFLQNECCCWHNHSHY